MPGLIVIQVYNMLKIRRPENHLESEFLCFPYLELEFSNEIYN